MSVLDRFEKSVEGAVNGVFAKFGSKDLQPVDLSSALEREIDAEAMPVGRDRTVAPNEYRFKLSTPDFDRIEAWGSETLANELADNLTEYAKSQHYAFVGPVIVIFEEDLDLSKGNFNLTSESVQGNAVPVTTDAQTEDSPVLEVNGNQYLLTKDKTVIGRGSGCDIVIDDPGISRKPPPRCSTATPSPSAVPASCTGPPPKPRSSRAHARKSSTYDRTDIRPAQVWIPDPAVDIHLAGRTFAAQGHRDVQSATFARASSP